MISNSSTGTCRLAFFLLVSFLILSANLAFSESVIPGCGEKELSKLLASDRAARDWFGTSVAVDKDIAVIGAPGDDDVRSGAGSAYLFQFDGRSWVELAKLTASDGAVDDSFGRAVAIDGDTIVVGAPSASSALSPRCGVAYVFVKPPTGWVDMTQTAKLTSVYASTSDIAGASVAVSGDVIVVGSPWADDLHIGSGIVYLYEKPPGGWVDTDIPFTLYPSDIQPSDFFGQSVSISGDVVAVGAYGADGGATDSGAAYVFVKPPAGWADMSQTAKLTASDGATGDRFGISISVSRDLVLVGAPNDDDDGGESGSVYVFHESAGGWVDKTESSKLTASDAAADREFGSSVAVSNNLAVIGSLYWDELSVVNYCSAYVYTYNGNALTEQMHIPTPEINFNDEFSWSVAAGNGFLLIGAPGDRTDFESGPGAAYVLHFFAPCEGNILHTAMIENTTSNWTRIGHRTANANPDAVIQVTQNWNPPGSSGVYNNAPIGVWWQHSSIYHNWNIFNQDISSMPLGAAFNLKIENPSASAFVHIAEPANINANWTTIDHPLTNGHPDAIVFVTQNWNPGGRRIGVYNNNPVGVWYDGYRWAVFNEYNWPFETAPAMPVDAAFNVTIATASDTAFVHTVTDENLWGKETQLDHPLLNGDRRARLILTQNYNPGGGAGVYNHAPVGVYFSTLMNRWRIFNEDRTDVAMGASFNVMILSDCEQSRIRCECLAVDYSGDGFINFFDFARLAGYWLQEEPLINIFPPATVDFIDVDEFTEHWLEQCH